MTALNVAVAGAGAFGVKHLEGLARIDGVRVVSLVGRVLDKTQQVAARFGVGHVTTVSEPPSAPTTYGRCEIQVIIDTREVNPGNCQVVIALKT